MTIFVKQDITFKEASSLNCTEGKKQATIGGDWAKGTAEKNVNNRKTNKESTSACENSQETANLLQKIVETKEQI